MIKNKNIFIIGIVSLLFFQGCGASRKVVDSELDLLYKKDFKGFEAPASEWIRMGSKQNYPHAAFDDLWDASLFVLIQKGVVVVSEKQEGKIVTMGRPPQAVLVENGIEKRLSLFTLTGDKAKDEQLRNSILERLRRGEVFDTVAAEYSDQESGWDRGFVRSGETNSVVAEKMALLGVGEPAIVLSPEEDLAYVMKVTDEREALNVYTNWIMDLHREAGGKKYVKKHFSPPNKDKLSQTFFDEVAVQMYAEEKWPWLYKDE